MVLSLLNAQTNKEQFNIIKRILPLFSIISILGTGLGIFFGVYYLFFKLNIVYATIFLIFLAIGIFSWILIERTVKRIETKAKKYGEV